MAEEKDVAGLEVVDELPALGLAALQVMSLVHDDQVVVNVADGATMGLATGGGQGGDDLGIDGPSLGPPVAKGLILVGSKVQAELLGELLLPLLHQGRRGYDEDTLYQAAQQVLLQHQASLDGLAQAHLVAQDGPAAEATQHGGGRLQLVGEGREAHGVGGQEDVEALYQGQLFGPEAQLQAWAIHAAAQGQTLQQGLIFRGQGYVVEDSFVFHVSDFALRGSAPQGFMFRNCSSHQAMRGGIQAARAGQGSRMSAEMANRRLKRKVGVKARARR